MGAGRVALLVLCVTGIYSAYLTQGLVSESLAQKRYGLSDERFGSLEALNGAQSLCCFLWAWVIMQCMVQLGQIKPEETANWFDYWRAGITNSIGPAFGMIALKNITYSAQVLVKSCKMVPVMVRPIRAPCSTDKLPCTPMHLHRPAPHAHAHAAHGRAALQEKLHRGGVFVHDADWRRRGTVWA